MTTTGTDATSPSSAFVAFVLHQLDCARLRALCAANEIATTATALSGGIISAEAAILHLDQLGSPLIESSSGI